VNFDEHLRAVHFGIQQHNRFVFANGSPPDQNYRRHPRHQMSRDGGMGPRTHSGQFLSGHRVGRSARLWRKLEFSSELFSFPNEI
jgi:hypothetical protein